MLSPETKDGPVTSCKAHVVGSLIAVAEAHVLSASNLSPERPPALPLHCIRAAPKDIKVRLPDGKNMTWRLRSNKDLERNLSCPTRGFSVLKEEKHEHDIY